MAPRRTDTRGGATARRARIDAELVRRGLSPSREQARRLIAEGGVTINGAPVTKPSSLVAPGDAVAVRARDEGWASRGARKLAAALPALGVDPAGRVCLDAGASTGGFTDALLRAGAAQVIAVDVGYGQLAWRLRTDARVVVLERTNVRHLSPGDLPPPAPDLAVADLSFISLSLVLPALHAVSLAGADFVLLVKPQFEVGRERVGKGGVVRDPEHWALALRRVAGAGQALGLRVQGACASPLPGPAGNVEFFLHLRERPAVPGARQGTGAAGPREGAAALEDVLAPALEEGRRLAGR